MTAGDLGKQPREGQALTALDEPGGDTLVQASSGNEVEDGPFTTRQLLRLDEALRVADESTGLTFSVYIGEFETPTREFAEKLAAQVKDSDHAVLLAVSPNQRKLEIVTGSEARKRISDRDAKLAGLSMAAAFAGGDLAGGVMAGLDQLASHAGRR
ncbi:hypothetical protein Ade02nite_21950 [Paractinoplanes deccanensis]|uniref:DUF5130 domain-containing protein n=1 Tax=Paractinoplanes deccanensis TaxID=113561 RepID=A0ABQ3Y0M4_9ACTN|nr:hypothetical protein Ade02nite_21950 [Actinoplanes deccanensis]